MLVEEDVRGFEVAVEDAALVGVMDGLGDFDEMRNAECGLAAPAPRASVSFRIPHLVRQASPLD